MNDFRFTLISTFIFIIIIGLGILAFFALETGDTNGSRQIVAQLREQVQEKDDALQDALRRIAEYESQGNVTTDESEDEEETEVQPSSSDTNQYQSLIDDIQRLSDRGVILEPGSRNADVGTIQEFLNAYNNTSGGVDNDFGPGTRSRVESFQTSAGTSVTGAVGPQTLGAMIEWMESNG